MYRFFFSFFIIILISCKKEAIITVDSLKKTDKIKNEDPIITIDTALIHSFNSKSLLEFYNARNNKTVWQLEKNRKTILEHLKNCESEGLNPLDYDIPKLLELEKKFKKLEEDQYKNYDLLMTYNFQKYLTHLHSGKLNPKNIYTDWDLNSIDFDVNRFIDQGFENNSFEEVIEKCKPVAVTYKELIKALEIINNFPDDQLQRIELKNKIELYDTNKAIVDIKKRLLYWKDLESNDSITAIYDASTLEAVKKFQTRHGLASDGVIGKGTIAALNFTKEERKHQIIANLERWRWFSTSLFTENYVLINIPNYSLIVVENQSIVLKKRIVVGKIKRKTPILISTLQSVVFNPTWTVPPTILKEDIVPELTKNRDFLKDKNITIYNSANEEVNPLDWNEKRPNSYRYVQSPGYYNSLGVVKITFPNRFSVYLHDTNHRNLFERNNRSLSSGCVRIENPLEFVQLLLNDPKRFSNEKIDYLIKTQKTTFFKIKKPFAIYQWYWTAWSENDKLIFRNDIYNLDADLYAKLRE